MKAKLLLGILLILMTVSIQAQRYITKNGHINFKSETAAETIEADNFQVNAALDSKTGEFVFVVLIKAFEFEKALMQEHFNENYMESDKYPKSNFNGKIDDLTKVNFSKEGKYTVTVSGTLTMHGVSKEIKVDGTIEVTKDGNLSANTAFEVLLEDYDIKRPKAVVKNLAEKVNVNVNVTLNKFK